MVKLFEALINSWCWLRVAASPSLVGVLIGAGVYGLLGGVAGVVLGGTLACAGVFLGVILANHARRKGELVDYAYGLSPPEKGSGGDDATTGSGRS